jgi:hypothetical protein
MWDILGVFNGFHQFVLENGVPPSTSRTFLSQ